MKGLIVLVTETWFICVTAWLEQSMLRNFTWSIMIQIIYYCEMFNFQKQDFVLRAICGLKFLNKSKQYLFKERAELTRSSKLGD